MLFNFISSSINSRQKDIGVLRAIGASGNDVLKIFFAETAIVCLACFGLSILVARIACTVMTKSVVGGMNIEILQFGILNILIIFATSVVVGLLGTVFPVIRASKKPPVDSIRTL